MYIVTIKYHFKDGRRGGVVLLSRINAPSLNWGWVVVPVWYVCIGTT